jgi:hypothetical protein
MYGSAAADARIRPFGAFFFLLITNRTASFGSLVNPQEAKFMRRSTLDW